MMETVLLRKEWQGYATATLPVPDTNVGGVIIPRFETRKPRMRLEED
jgi:hypothetical protein